MEESHRPAHYDTSDTMSFKTEEPTPSGQRCPASDEAIANMATDFVYTANVLESNRDIVANMKCYLKEVGYLTKLNPQDAWLPIVESRNGNGFCAAFDNLNTDVGFKALVLPFAFGFLE